MSLDSRARSAGREARTEARRGIDANAGLAALRTRHRRRAVARRVSVAAILAAVVGGAGLFVSGVRTAASIDPVGPLPTASSCPRGDCGDNTAVHRLTYPVTWDIPAGYEERFGSTAVGLGLRSSSDPSLVLVMEDARGGGANPDVNSPAAPETLAAWIVAQNYVGSSAVDRVILGGRPALHLVVTPSQRHALLVTRQALPVQDRAPLTVGDGWTSNYSKHSDYAPVVGRPTEIWLIAMPDGSVTAVLRPGVDDPHSTLVQELVLSSMSLELG
jgi:hypothetical protein